MSIQLQRRRGTSAENAAFTGAAGEFTYITDGKRIAAHDGSNAGGTLMPSNRDLINDYFGYAAASGTDTITLTVLAQITAYAAGQVFTFKASATNTGSATLNVNSLGAKTIKKKNPSGGTIDVLVAGDIINGGIYTVRYDGTDFQFISTDGAASGGLKVLATATASTSSSIDFTSLVSSDYESYEIHIKDFRPSSDNAVLLLRTSTDNGGTWDAGTGYESGLFGSRITGTDSAPVSLGPTAGTSGVWLHDGVGNAATEAYSGVVTILNPSGTTRPHAITCVGIGENPASVPWYEFGGGFRNATTAINAFQLIFSAGNITSGKATLYGRKIA